MKSRHAVWTAWMTGLFALCLLAGAICPLLAGAADEALTQRYLNQLQTGTNSQRADAAWTLGKSYIKRTPEVIPALIKALSDSYPIVRSNAAGALSKIGPEAKAAIPALKGLLTDSHGRAVVNAAIALRKMGVPTKELTPSVRAVLNYPDGVHRVDAVSLLRSWGISDREMTPILAATLTDENQKARLRAIREFLEISCIEGEAFDRVMAALGDPYDLVRLHAAMAMRRNCGAPVKQAVAPLIVMLDDSSWPVRESATNALHACGPLAQPAVPKLLSVLNSTDNDSLLKATCQALGAIGGPRKSEIGAAIARVLTSHPQWSVRMSAALSLRDLQCKDAVVIDALKKASQQDNTQGVRSVAGMALKQLTPGPKAK